MFGRFLSIQKESFTKRTSSSVVKSSESIEILVATQGLSFRPLREESLKTHVQAQPLLLMSSLIISVSISQPVVAEFQSLSLSS